MISAAAAARLSRPLSRLATARLPRRTTVSRPSSRTMATQGTYTYEWPRPGLTIDVVALAPASSSTPHLLLIQRGQPPAQGAWALPGGFVEPEEHLDAAAARELAEETGLEVGGGGSRGASLRQVRAFGGPDRDPRGWTVTVAYAAVVNVASFSGGAPPAVKGMDDAAAAQGWPVGALPPHLAFDHARIISSVLRSVAGVEGQGQAWAGELVASAVELEAREWVPTRE